jgi:hypothetical protein
MVGIGIVLVNGADKSEPPSAVGAFGWRSASSAAVQAVKLDGFSRRGTSSIINSVLAEL